MTCGIYRLVFRGTSKVYVGQSKNIEARYLDHISGFNKGIGSIKLLNAVALYGLPILDILVECGENELDSNENESIEIWDSYNNGFNSRNTATGGGRGSYGELNGRSKYSNEAIENAFLLLVGGMSGQSISEICNINLSTVHALSRGENHKWLKTKYADKYDSLMSSKGSKQGSAESRGIVYPDIMNKAGEIYKVSNVRQFALSHGLDRGALNKVLNRKALSTGGWRLV